MSNGTLTDPSRQPAKFLRPLLNKQAELNYRDPALDVPGMAPNYGEHVLPHVITFQGLMTTISKVYRPSDEAMLHSKENARFMRNDLAVMECLENRQRAVCLLDWHLKPEDEKDQRQKALCDDLKAIIERTPRFHQLRETLQEALWYGKYGVSMRYRWDWVGGKKVVAINKWRPVHGDKLVFRIDDGSGDYDPDQIGIRVGPTWISNRHLDPARIQQTDWGMAYFLEGYERKLMAVHTHRIEDGEYEDPWSAGRIHGVGIRHRVYWTWYQAREALAWLMEFLERSAFGLEIWYYPWGSKSAEQKMRTAAQERIGQGRNIILVPRRPDQPGAYGVEKLEVGMAGAEVLRGIINDLFGHQIKRYILGQTLTTEAASTGLGSNLAAIHQDTYLQIIRYDARNQDETVTKDIVAPLKEKNFPWAKNVHVRFVTDTETPDAESTLKAWREAYDMGCRLKESDVMKTIGAATPEESDSVLVNPQLEQAKMQIQQAREQEAQAEAQRQAQVAQEKAAKRAQVRGTGPLIAPNELQQQLAAVQMEEALRQRGLMLPEQPESSPPQTPQNTDENAQGGLNSADAGAESSTDQQPRSPSEEPVPENSERVKLRAYEGIEQYARDRDSGAGQWITIGGASEGGKKHAGGTPVKVGPGGEVQAGPPGVKGRPMHQVDQDKLGAGASPAGHREMPPEIGRASEAIRAMQARGGGESVGPGTLQSAEGRQAWAWFSANMSDPRVELDRSGKYPRFIFHGPDGDTILRQAGGPGLPFPAEFKPRAADTRQPENSPKAQGTMFPGIRRQAESQEPEPAADQQQPLFDKKGGHDFGPGVMDLPDGRKVGTTQLGVQDLHADPARFQYKVSGVGKGGVTEELQEIGKYRPEFGGQLLAWYDPQDGKAYVVNGHHRYELAERSGYQGQLNAFLIDAKNAAEARAIGALANIAEGRGTALDAAKFMRETGRGPADMAKEGISLKGKIAQDAASLAKASDQLFSKVALGTIAEPTALAITRHLDNHGAQNKLLSRLEAREKAGKKRLSDETLEEAARTMAAAPKITQTVKSLFGSEEEEELLWEERAEATRHLRQAMRESKLAFRGGSKASRAERLKEAGNVLDVEKNKQLAQKAAEDEWIFNRQANMKGELSDLLAQAAKELHDEPRKRKTILAGLEERAAAILRPDTPGGLEAARGTHAGDPGASAAGGTGGRRDAPQQLAGATAGGPGRVAVAAAPERYSRDPELIERFARFAAGQKSLWEETEHPRDADGQFTDKEGGEASAPKKAEGPGEPSAEEKAAYESYTDFVKGKLTPKPIGDWLPQFRAVQERIRGKQKDETPAKEPDDAKAGYVSIETGTPLVKIAESGQISLKRPETIQEATAALDAMNRIHDAAEAEFKAAGGEVQAALRFHHVNAQLQRAITNAKPFQAAASEPETTEEPERDTAAAVETPRERAREQTQRDIDEQYAFARKSKIGNVGEDLLGSARHKANAWRGLEEAEREGTAAELVTRDMLLKNEPHRLMLHVSQSPLTVLAMHQALRLFPAKPGYAKRRGATSDDQAKTNRQQYLEAYRELKASAEGFAASGADAYQACEKLDDKVSDLIRRYRGQKSTEYMDQVTAADRYNDTANALVPLHKALYGVRSRFGSATIKNRLNDFAQAVKEKYGLEKESWSPETFAETIGRHVGDILEGRSLPESFGTKGEARKRFDPADLYVGKAVRTGKQLKIHDQHAAKTLLVDKMGIRGLQFGNYVTDEEREHHLIKSAEALSDLADVLELPAEYVSWKGKLGIAYGARGKGNATAHYEPGQVVINLTRASGAGSLAHEWGHFFDHALAGFQISTDVDAKSGGDYESERTSAKRFVRDPNDPHGWAHDEKGQMKTHDRTSEPLFAAYDGLRKSWADSGFKSRLRDVLQKAVDDGLISVGKANDYWKTNREVFARCFERFVQRKLEHRGDRNTYLAGLAPNAKGSEGIGLWPTDQEVDAMAPHFEKILGAFREGVEKGRYSLACHGGQPVLLIAPASLTEQFNAAFAAASLVI